MTAVEVGEFSSNPNWQAVLRVRRYDDAGKIADMKTHDFSHYAPMVQQVVDGHGAKQG